MSSSAKPHDTTGSSEKHRFGISLCRGLVRLVHDVAGDSPAAAAGTLGVLVPVAIGGLLGTGWVGKEIGLSAPAYQSLALIVFGFVALVGACVMRQMLRRPALPPNAGNLLEDLPKQGKVPKRLPKQGKPPEKTLADQKRSKNPQRKTAGSKGRR
ncbi:hypothetical protein ACFWAP_12630 [Streptomyces goshikiensis]|uniref:hypothetical protein n=1 Tax=Streptomyces goshikiensis TaxID=1942 RepID=UPI00364D3503